MTAYEKAYNHEKGSDGELYKNIIKILICVTITAIIAIASSDDSVNIISYVLAIILFIVVILIVRIFEKNSPAVDNRFSQVREKLGYESVDGLNERLEKMACFCDSIFIDSDYYINFHTGKVAKTEYITGLRKIISDARYSRFSNSSYILIIDYQGVAKFENARFRNRSELEAVYGALNIITLDKENNSLEI